MSRKVKVIGAGSIGNHLSNAARRMGWSVVLSDADAAALERTRTQIYPSRYGAWDESITLCQAKDAPVGGFDMICIGTPPDVHIPLALAAVREKPALVLVEKPLCPPDCAGMQELAEEAARLGVKVCVGYDHVVAKSVAHIESLITSQAVGEVVTLDVEFREHWGGIFKAHPWLSGPWETYLGYWKRGGGSGGEHSHAANLWQHFARVAGKAPVSTVSALVEFKKEREAEYDEIFSLHVRCTDGFYGRIIQDVVTQPTRKWARIQGTRGAIEWHANQGAKGDVVLVLGTDGTVQESSFPKTRPDDFIREMEHLDAVISGTVSDSQIGLDKGMATMRLVAAGYESGRSGDCVKLV